MTSRRQMLSLAFLLTAALPVTACAKSVPDGDVQNVVDARQSGSAGSQGSTPPLARGAFNGGLTLHQFEKRREQRIMSADTNRDGRVSRAEFVAEMPSGKGNPAKRFARIDRNGDGFIDRQEIDEAAARRFAKLDADGDGRVSRSERKGGHLSGPSRTPQTAEVDPN